MNSIMLDELCRKKILFNAHLLVPWWIMAAYAYDVDDDPIISDGLFDHIAERLTNEWDEIEHWHKDLLDKTLLKSSIAINGKWPSRAIGSLEWLRSNHGRT